ncbi:uncharacterized protein HD556DRAFT_91529 [Suillus plorans]|uniref:Uncharacterized protein n=1 Tax=Suillus plorans TaxID=116603 RepID=A0A9P7AB61_9AGAM|nr:uncharacterized protein HD556DRAFT_91529 [Suillus plorans]KAG1785783.1 hypothetical protein HD556DRAFT_91529 [Suillus plorans]
MHSVRRGLFHPDDTKVLGILSGSPGLTISAALPSLSWKAPHLHGSTTHKFDTITFPSSFVGSGSGVFGYLGRGEAKRATSHAELGKYAKDDDDISIWKAWRNYSRIAYANCNLGMACALFRTSCGDLFHCSSETIRSKTLDNPLVEIYEGLAEVTLKLISNKNARFCSMVNQLIDGLTPSAPNFQLRDAWDQQIKKQL